MTLPDERLRAIRNTKTFLKELANSYGPFKNVPSQVRRVAALCLHHFPTEYDLYVLTEAAPDLLKGDLDPEEALKEL